MAWGFLAVFFAGVALRHTELSLSGAHKDRQGLLVNQPPHEPKETPAQAPMDLEERLDGSVKPLLDRFRARRAGNPG